VVSSYRKGSWSRKSCRGRGTSEIYFSQETYRQGLLNDPPLPNSGSGSDRPFLYLEAKNSSSNVFSGIQGSLTGE
jgi:hypothetical protein